MKLTAAQDGDTMLFSAPASEQSGLASNVYLGTFYSGASVNLKVMLHVPLEMGNECQNASGVVNWVFTAEEFPIESTDPIPKTGDTTEPAVYWPLAGILAGALLLVRLAAKQKRL